MQEQQTTNHQETSEDIPSSAEPNDRQHHESNPGPMETQDTADTQPSVSQEEPEPTNEIGEEPTDMAQDVAEVGVQDTAEQVDDDRESILERLAGVEELIRTHTTALEGLVEKKVAYDRFKEEQIERMHKELVAHKRNLLGKAMRPLIDSIIRLHDSLHKTERELHNMPAEELTPEVFFDVLNGFGDDIEIVLEQQGVVLYSEPEARFNPRRQVSRRNVPTGDEALAGTIAGRLRPGFEQDDDLLQKERVEVYVRAKGSEQPEPHTPEPPEAAPVAEQPSQTEEHDEQ